MFETFLKAYGSDKIYVRNTCPVPTYTAINHFPNSDSVTKYWFKVEPGKTRLIFNEDLGGSRFFAYFSHDNNGNCWGNAVGSILINVEGVDLPFTSDWGGEVRCKRVLELDLSASVRTTELVQQLREKDLSTASGSLPLRTEQEVDSAALFGTLQSTNSPDRESVEDFERKLLRCRDKLSELRRLSRNSDVELGFLYQRMEACGSFYQLLLDFAIKRNIAWNSFSKEHREIEKFVTQIQENIEWKQYQRRMTLIRETPSWVGTLGTLASIADNAMHALGLRPVAGYIYQGFLQVLGLLTGRDYLRLPQIKYLPPSR